MSRKEYEAKIAALIASHKEAVSAIQKEYAREYNLFRPGDLVRGINGWRNYFRIKKVSHFAEGHSLYTVLSVQTVKRTGEPHARSHENTVRDEDVVLIERQAK